MRTHGDFLRAQNLLDGLRPPRTRFYRSIVGYNHHLAPVHATDGRDHTRRRRCAIVLIVSNEQANFLRVFRLVKEQSDSLARRQLALLVLALSFFGTTTLTELRFQFLQLRHEIA